MEVLDLIRKEGESLSDIEAMLEGRVFHVTKRIYWPAICTAGEIRQNHDGRLPSSFGFSANSFFKNRGCVSLFDYRAPPDETIRDFRSRCNPFQPATPGEEGIAILLLSHSLNSKLVDWAKWKEENAFREMVVPYVEVGHPGPISLSQIDQVVFLRIEEDASSLAAILRKARASKGAG